MTQKLSALFVFLILVGAAQAQLLPLPDDKPAAAATVAKLPVWDVVSVKEHRKDDGMMRWGDSADGLQMTNLPLTMILQQAYRLWDSGEEQLTGLPGWAKTTRFDIDAKVSADDVPAWKGLNAPQRAEMLRTLLVERFGLKARPVTREMPVYNLVLAKAGPKLAIAAPEKIGSDGKVLDGAHWSTHRGSLEATDCGIATLVSTLTQASGRTVIDRTGLTGKYDYKLEWTPTEDGNAGAGDSGKLSAPSLFTALQEQLGLKLEPARGPVEGLLVESVHLPSAN